MILKKAMQKCNASNFSNQNCYKCLKIQKQCNKIMHKKMRIDLFLLFNCYYCYVTKSKLCYEI